MMLLSCTYIYPAQVCMACGDTEPVTVMVAITELTEEMYMPPI